MALVQKLASTIKAIFDPMTALEERLTQKVAERQGILNHPGDPAQKIAAFRAQLDLEQQKVKGRAFNIINHGADLRTVLSTDSVLLFMMPEMAKRIEDAFLEMYPKDWISEADRADRLKKNDEERRSISRELCRAYDELQEAHIEHVPSPEIDPGIFLGTEP